MSVGAQRVPIPEQPGFYRMGAWVVFPYRDQRRRQHWGRARNLTEAKRLKAQLITDAARGELLPRSNVTVPEYAKRWIETYQGRTRKAIEEHTRTEYRERLKDANEYFAGVRLTDVRAQDVKEFATWVGGRPRRRKRKGKPDLRPLSETSVRMALAPVKAMFATAFEEGLIRANPTAGVRIVVPRSKAANVDEDGGLVKALTEKQLDGLLGAIAAVEDGRWLLFFRLLATFGLRISEVIELRWRDIDLGTRTVRIRRNYYDGKVGALKTKYSRRDLKLNETLGRELWQLRKESRPREGDLVFTSLRGQRVDPSNLMSRLLKPAAVSAGVGEWVGFHTFRHTCASLLFNDAGWNPKQVQVWLGHHSPAFTLERYVHLLPADLPDPPLLGRNVRRNSIRNIGPRTAPQSAAADSVGIAAQQGGRVV